MRAARRSLAGALPALTLLAASAHLADPAQAPPEAPLQASFTAAQAEAGQAVYARACAASHLPSLQGTFEAPRGLAFAGDFSRTVRAYEVTTGRVLWESRLGNVVMGFPISYEVDGVQYLAVPAGEGGGSPWQVANYLAPELYSPGARNRSTCSGWRDRRVSSWHCGAQDGWGTQEVGRLPSAEDWRRG